MADGGGGNRLARDRRSRWRHYGGLTAITIQGFKSIMDPTRIEFRPLTILAGANSGGKSSAMQPLLLLKQTSEASYDPGPLLLSGPNIKFTSPDQILSKRRGEPVDWFSLGIEDRSGGAADIVFQSSEETRGFEIKSVTYRKGSAVTMLTPDMPTEALTKALPSSLLNAFMDDQTKKLLGTGAWGVRRNRYLLEPVYRFEGPPGEVRGLPLLDTPDVESITRGMIHVPALRGNPERTYFTTATGPTFPGTFEKYVASVISSWQEAQSPNMEKLNDALLTLGLTWKVTARPVDSVNVEVQVGRLPHGKVGGAYDLVSIADIGFGVSQVLPVIVALTVAEEGQIVFLEQPEIHLHPKAQYEMGRLLVGAAKRGVSVVVETHSSLLLRAVQTQVAEGRIRPTEVMLHWFARRPNDGVTTVQSISPDQKGTLGKWPQDFDDTALQAESRYLDAASRP